MRRIFLLFLLVACGQGISPLKDWYAQDGKLKVVSTTAMINDLVKGVGGESIKTLVLIQGDLDPHSYQLVKGDDEKLQSSDLIFYNGLGLEHGPSLKEYLLESNKAHPLGEAIFKQDPEKILIIDGVADPHVWMDISLFSQAIPEIVKVLGEKMPENKQQFEKNGEALQASLLKGHNRVKEILQAIPSNKRYLVTSHDAFNYFARAYLKDPEETDWSLRFQAPEGLAPESQLSLSNIVAIIDHLNRFNIQVLFPESNVSRDSIKKIVDAGTEKGLKLTIASTPLYGDAMGPKGSDGDTYLKMIEHNGKTIAHYLGGSL
jgi:manganese/zinc/iron transport system substrate-binding protein